MGSNELVLQQLRDGTAQFELLLHHPTPPSPPPTTLPLFFFARIGTPTGFGSSLPRPASPAMKKVERYSVHKVTGDGRCLFRALVKGMAYNKGNTLNLRQEKDDADELRMAVKEIICDNDRERLQYEEALIAITVEEPLKRYCQRIERSDFWGGESELLVLSKLCQQLVIVYIPEHEHTSGTWGNGFIPIAEYGTGFRKASNGGKQKMAVKLLYSGKNHYDLLI